MGIGEIRIGRKQSGNLSTHIERIVRVAFVKYHIVSTLKFAAFQPNVLLFLLR